MITHRRLQELDAKVNLGECLTEAERNELRSTIDEVEQGHLIRHRCYSYVDDRSVAMGSINGIDEYTPPDYGGTVVFGPDKHGRKLTLDYRNVRELDRLRRKYRGVRCRIRPRTKAPVAEVLAPCPEGSFVASLKSLQEVPSGR